MKWFVGVLLGGVVILAILAFMFRGLVGFMIFRASVKPQAGFAETAAPAPPDYAKSADWAALPWREDMADYTPDGVTDRQDEAAVDVFFVHPTTFIENSGWNAPMGHEAADELVDDFVLRGQASAYNGSARVFAPHYRQAQIYAFFSLEEGGQEALELAYSDVEAAFDHYLDQYNEGRPFILAGHSQGALHVRWLLERRISATPLAGQLVAAYPVGYYFPAAELAESLPDIPVCTSGEQTGCLVTWNATGKGYRSFEPTTGMVCVNPLNWKSDGSRAGFDANLGAMSTERNGVIAQAADARCQDGRLFISEIRTDAFDDLPMDLGPGNYHLLDYALYWSNLRENVARRVEAFRSR
ncbi:MAG: DUF3089 domain-containing protein [Alphaproteobacteria bacterium]|jgi:hypothetical protein|nr:DUF3089 domain-containing protein [Alphaproteobacteria bacterium]